MIQIRILRWPEISQNLIAHCPRIFSKGHLPVCINPAWVTKFLIQRTCIWPEILPVTGTCSTCCMTKELWDVANYTWFVRWTICEAGGVGGGGGGLRGWFILEKIYTCTKLIFSWTTHCRIRSTAPLCTVSAAPVNYASDNSCLYLTAVFVTKYDKANTVD